MPLLTDGNVTVIQHNLPVTQKFFNNKHKDALYVFWRNKEEATFKETAVKLKKFTKQSNLHITG